MSEYQRRYHELRDPEFWKKLNPDLTVTLKARPIESPKLGFSDEILESVKAKVRSDGYFQLDGVFDRAQMDRLAGGVENIYRANLPTAFAVVYDEYWQMFHSLRGLFEGLLGDGYKQIPNFWCWFVERSNESKGWAHHRDRPAFSSVDQTGMPSSLTVWIPLTDADESNGCIYVLPSKYDPNFRGDLGNNSIADYQSVIALPAKRGSVLSWSENLLHWGGRSSERAINPRVSISFAFQRTDINPYERPLIDCTTFPDFDERLGLIGQNISNYADRSNAAPEVLQASRRLSSLMPTVVMQNGHYHEMLESDKALSESMLWSMQEGYYTDRKMQSWRSGDVPFYSTSRMPFVEGCAELAVSMLLDCQSSLDFNEPFYVLELGGGLGCFAQRFLAEFIERKADFEVLDRLKFVYILSDFSQEIVEQHFDNPCLKDYLANGLLELSVFRPESDRVIKLIKSGRNLDKGLLKNPLFVVANYFFDTIRQDAFRVIPGILQEARYSLYRDGGNEPLQGRPQLSEIRMSERFSDVDLPHYGEPGIDAILEFYKKNLTEASVLLPIGALRSIKNLSEISNQKLALLTSDKGFTSLESRQVLGLSAQQYVCHGGCFSFDVNFDAIARYFANIGGRAISEAGDHRSLGTLFGTTLKSKLPLTEHYFRQNMQLKDAFNSSFNLEEVIYNLNPDQHSGVGLGLFLSIVQSYNYEPHMFQLAFDTLYEAVERESQGLDKQCMGEIIFVVRKTYRNLFPTAAMEGHLDALLRCCLAVKCFEECIELAGASISRFGPLNTAFDHAGLASEALGDKEGAFKYYSQSVELKPDHAWAREGMERNQPDKPLVLEENEPPKKVGVLSNWFGGWKH